MAGTGVAAHVAQALLDDAQDALGHVQRDVQRATIYLERGLDTGSSGELVDLPAQRVHQAAFFERGRAQGLDRPARFAQRRPGPLHGLLHHLLRPGRVAALQVPIHCLQLQDQPRQPLGQRVVQLLGHPLPFLADRQFLHLGRVLLQLAMGGFELAQQRLRLLPGLHLPDKEHHVDDHESQHEPQEGQELNERLESPGQDQVGGQEAKATCDCQGNSSQIGPQCRRGEPSQRQVKGQGKPMARNQQRGGKGQNPQHPAIDQDRSAG